MPSASRARVLPQARAGDRAGRPGFRRQRTVYNRWRRDPATDHQSEGAESLEYLREYRYLSVRTKLEIARAREYVRGLEAQIDAKNSEIEKASRHIQKLEGVDAERVKQLEAASKRIAELEGRSEEA